MAFTVDHLPQLSEPDELRANVHIKTLTDDVYSDIFPNLISESNAIIVFVGLTLVETAPINDSVPLFTPVASYRRHKLPQEADVKYTRCALRAAILVDRSPLNTINPHLDLAAVQRQFVIEEILKRRHEPMKVAHEYKAIIEFGTSDLTQFQLSQDTVARSNTHIKTPVETPPSENGRRNEAMRQQVFSLQEDGCVYLTPV